MNPITVMELQENPQIDLRALISNCNFIRLELIDGSCRDITSPNLGREYLSGRLEDGKTIGVFRSSALRSVEFAFEASLSSSILEYTRRTIGELLTTSSFPALARLGYLEPNLKMQQVRLVGIARGFLFTDFHSHPAIPIAALGTLEISCE